MGGRGANSQQAHDVVLTSMRRNDVVSTSLRRHVIVPTGFLINQSQIITFRILKSDIENSRKELKGIVLPVPSNQIIVTFIAIFTLKLGTFVIFGGMPPLPLASSYVYVHTTKHPHTSRFASHGTFNVKKWNTSNINPNCSKCPKNGTV